MKLIMNDMIRSRADSLMRWVCYHDYRMDTDGDLVKWCLTRDWRCQNCAKPLTQDEYVDYVIATESSASKAAKLVK